MFSLYPIIREILFCLEPETAHSLTLRLLYYLEKTHSTFFFPQTINLPCQIMGLHFKNPVGLAAGLDKNGDYIDALAALGFGFIEIGSLTPQPQLGNPRPRLFRLKRDKALINRMGFNNKGVAYAVERLKKMRFKGILGVNIGKNLHTPVEDALHDYLQVFYAVAPFASYITINISSPNTKNLRSLQGAKMLLPLLQGLKKAQNDYYVKAQRYVPCVIKISPDLEKEDLLLMTDIFLQEKVDGVIATNTTIQRAGFNLSSARVSEMGGLSGKPLAALVQETIATLYARMGQRIPIIGCGGILDGETAWGHKKAGASLLQIYTGLIYQGPKLIPQIINYLKAKNGNA